MKIFTAEDMAAIDAATVAEGTPAIELMERAAKGIAQAVVHRWGCHRPVVVFAGQGNNGGDGLAAARLLAEKGCRVEAYLFNPSGKLSTECDKNKAMLIATKGAKFVEVKSEFAPPSITEAHIVLDALFGAGLNKPLQGGFAAVVRYINATKGTVVSIDLPSGLMSEENSFNNTGNVVRANLTLAIERPKLSFFFAEHEEMVGTWQTVPIGLSEQAMQQTETPFSLTEVHEVSCLLRPRKRFAHKGTMGHALVVVGSKGMAGAGIMAAKAALRSGVGLVTAHVPEANRSIMQTAVPEVVVQTDICDTHITNVEAAAKHTAVCVGPGIGRDEETVMAVHALVTNVNQPMVVDADGINILADYKHLLHHLPEESILTPHPKEFDRLVGGCTDSYERLAKACELAESCQVHIVLKGAYTTVISPGGVCRFNPTGNPGMATAGSGDVLSGVITALLAQGYKPQEAATIGTYVHGLAGDMAAERLGQTALMATDIIDALPQAWSSLEPHHDE